MSSGDDLTCQELVELVTDYLEGALPAQERVRFEEHLLECAGCHGYLDQVRKIVARARRLSEADLSPDVREKLLYAFRKWKAS
jgi:anti-sigma factor RsiW